MNNLSINFLDDRLPPRFWSHVLPEPNSGCWLWIGAGSADATGYGRIQRGRRGEGLELTHRMSYLALVGPVPDGLEIDHLCRVRCCCNPAHLEPVTHLENARRGIAGACAAAFQHAKTHCPAGHVYAGDNLYVHRGKRYCRECVRNNLRASRARRGQS